MGDGDRAGVVLAGGYSTRFGEEDKALAEVQGEPMLNRVASRLGEVVNTVIINCRSDQREPFDQALGECDLPKRRFAVDSEPDSGPLAGIETAFEDIEAEYTAVVACDMPKVDGAFIDFLFDCADGKDGAAPKTVDGHYHPIQAVYQTETMRAVAKHQLANGDRSLQAALSHLDIADVPAKSVAGQTDPRTLWDVNTHEELDTFNDELTFR